MKRVTVEEGDEGESVAKGMVIADSEIETLEDLKVGNFNHIVTPKITRFLYGEHPRRLNQKSPRRTLGNTYS